MAGAGGGISVPALAAAKNGAEAPVNQPVALATLRTGTYEAAIVGFNRIHRDLLVNLFEKPRICQSWVASRRRVRNAVVTGRNPCSSA